MAASTEEKNVPVAGGAGARVSHPVLEAPLAAELALEELVDELAAELALEELADELAAEEELPPTVLDAVQ